MCVWLEAICECELEAEGNNSLPRWWDSVMVSMEQPGGEPARQNQLAIKGPTKLNQMVGLWLL